MVCNLSLMLIQPMKNYNSQRIYYFSSSSASAPASSVVCKITTDASNVSCLLSAVVTISSEGKRGTNKGQ